MEGRKIASKQQQMICYSHVRISLWSPLIKSIHSLSQPLSSLYYWWTTNCVWYFPFVFFTFLPLYMKIAVEKKSHNLFKLLIYKFKFTVILLLYFSNIRGQQTLVNRPNRPAASFINKVLLEHKHIHSFYCLWLLLSYNSRIEKDCKRL